MSCVPKPFFIGDARCEQINATHPTHLRLWNNATDVFQYICVCIYMHIHMHACLERKTKS